MSIIKWDVKRMKQPPRKQNLSGKPRPKNNGCGCGKPIKKK